jgi:endonuclease III
MNMQAPIEKIVLILSKHYSEDEFARKNRRDPFRVLVSCLISLRTKDEVTFKATERLFSIASTPERIAALPEKKIEKAIYPSGFYRVKAKRIREISRKLVDEYAGNVPDTIEELLKFKGVGRKTANIVITFGFNKPGIAVDTHVHRITNRLGLVRTKDPTETEFAIKKILPEKHWIRFNELFVRHGQSICRPISPICSRCMIIKYCRQIGVETKR